MSDSIQNKKTVIITGVSQGLGLITANEFVTNGWGVIGTGRSGRPELLDSNVQYYSVDASNAETANDLWQELGPIVKESSAVALVNNAGRFAAGPFAETKPDEFEKQMLSNYFVAVNMTRGLLQHAHSARIINVISASALKPSANSSAYNASKGASKHFFQSLQKELDSSRYQITNIYPSDIATDGPRPNSISPVNLAIFLRDMAENRNTFYLTDATLFPLE